MALNKAEELRLLQRYLADNNIGWEAGVTSVSELPPEIKRRMCGAAFKPGEETALERERRAAAIHKNAALPPVAQAIDWRNVGGKNYVSPIKDQGECGSCVAFSAAATVESAIRITRNAPVNAQYIAGCVDLSEAELFYCVARSQGRDCAIGWFNSSALESLEKDGVSYDSCFPYTDGDQACSLAAGDQEVLTQISGSTTLSTAADMKNWLLNTGPVMTSFNIYDDFYNYKSGVYKKTSTVGDGSHSVCCIGFDDNLGAWLCKNSWGTGWGMSGFFWIGYGQCGIDASMSGITGLTKSWIGWSGNQHIPGINSPRTLTFPALAAFNEKKLYMAYRGESATDLYWAWLEGANWAGNVHIPGINHPKTATSPALAAFDGKLYMAYRGESATNLYWAWFDGTNWAGNVHIPNINSPKTATSPALAVFNGKLYMAYRGESATDLYWAWYDGAHWQGNVHIPGINSPKTATSPALAAFNGKLYMVYRGESATNLYWAWFDGTLWHGNVHIPGINNPKTFSSPALAVVGNRLILSYRGESATDLYFAWFDSETWGGNIHANQWDHPKTATAPALAFYNEQLYMAYRGETATNLYWSWLVDAPQ
jgi:hypothetical protein